MTRDEARSLAMDAHETATSLRIIAEGLEQALLWWTSDRQGGEPANDNPPAATDTEFLALPILGYALRLQRETEEIVRGLRTPDPKAAPGGDGE